jgi:membrane protein DedA with SNARE-associated domain
MNFLPDDQTLSHWLVKYGSLSLFILLTLGIIAFPVPEESLMVLSGILIRHKKMKLIPTFLATFGGSICGITCSYLIGKTAGSLFLKKYGAWAGINEKKIERAHLWFLRWGKWALLIGYFIPGIRHLSGFSAGLSRLEYRKFALFAYTGALLWVSTFLLMGYFFGDYFLDFLQIIEVDIDSLILLALLLLFIFYFWRHRHKKNKSEDF